MAGLAQEHYAAAFAGAPPGYAGAKEGLSVFDRDRIEGTVSMPGIVLFDEVEKAHPTVLRALLHVLDRGQLTLANGQQRFDFRNCLVFMTSNLGSRELRAVQQGRRQRWGQGLVRLLPALAAGRVRGRLDRRLETVSAAALTRFFDTEFLNRIDEVTVFAALDEPAALAVVGYELELCVRRARARGLALEVGAGVAEHLVQIGFDPVYGARSVRRVVRHAVWPPVAAAVIGARAERAGEAGEAARAGVASGGELPCTRLVVEDGALECRPG